MVLIAHGSRNPDAAAGHASLVARVRRRSAISVVPAFLELNEPSIPRAIDDAVAAGATTVRLLPYFLHVGNHVASDLPELAAEARRRHAGVEVVLEEHIGADPALVDLVARRIDQAEDHPGSEPSTR